jgi:hypothetical protein
MANGVSGSRPNLLAAGEYENIPPAPGGPGWRSENPPDPRAVQHQATSSWSATSPSKALSPAADAQPAATPAERSFPMRGGVATYDRPASITLNAKGGVDIRYTRLTKGWDEVDWHWSLAPEHVPQLQTELAKLLDRSAPILEALEHAAKWWDAQTLIEKLKATGLPSTLSIC